MAEPVVFARFIFDNDFVSTVMRCRGCPWSVRLPDDFDPVKVETEATKHAAECNVVPFQRKLN